MTSPKPALVTHRAARRLPRWALLLMCGLYLLPGLVGREPWRGAEFTAFGQMVAMAEGRTSWWTPALGMVPGDTALLSHWWGASFIVVGTGIRTAHWCDRLERELGLPLVPADSSLYRAVGRYFGLLPAA